MPARFVDLDRQTPMFLPYDLREWVPADHIVHFILDAVEQVPISDFGQRPWERQRAIPSQDDASRC